MKLAQLRLTGETEKLLSGIILVLSASNIFPNSDGVTPQPGAKYRWGINTFYDFRLICHIGLSGKRYKIAP